MRRLPTISVSAFAASEIPQPIMPQTVDSEKLRFILGYKLKNLRQQQGLSLKQAAQDAGLSISYLSEIEKGKKNPRTDKLIALAQTYGTSFDQLLVSAASDGNDPVGASLDSGFFSEFPFELFGLQAEDLFSLLTSSPDRAGALIRTFMEVGEMYDIRIDQFLFAALRAYQKLHNNYFPELEEAAEEFVSTHPKLVRPFDERSLRRVLEGDWGYVVDDEQLTHNPDLSGFRSVLLPGTKPRLLINPRLLPEQRAFIYAKEIGNRVLDLEIRPTTSSWIKVESFEQVLNNYRTSYFAGALLLGRDETTAGLRSLFSQPTFDPAELLGLMYRLRSTPEMFFYRIGQLAAAEFGLGEHYFMRLANSRGEAHFDVTKMLNLSQLSLPRGLSTNEHYCRKWAGMRLLKDRAAQREIAFPDMPARNEPTVAAQRIMVGGEEVFTFAISRIKQLTQTDDSCVILGFRIDDAFKKSVSFWNDPALPLEPVGITCERCPLPLERCSERVAEPEILVQEDQIDRYETALADLMDRFNP